MQELQKRQKLRRILYSLPALLLLALVAFFLAKGAAGIMSKERESAARVTELEGRISSLSERRGELEDNLRLLETEEGIIEEIRGKFNVARAGEKVAIIVDERSRASSTPDSGWLWYRKLRDAIMRR